MGDGVNDAPAVSIAHCAGTPAIDRPFLPARTDFYFTTAGLHPVPAALATAPAVARANARNLAAASADNVPLLPLPLPGRLSPLPGAGTLPANNPTFSPAPVVTVAVLTCP